jgi:hypothetical protein
LFAKEYGVIQVTVDDCEGFEDSVSHDGEAAGRRAVKAIKAKRSLYVAPSIDEFTSLSHFSLEVGNI